MSLSSSATSSPEDSSSSEVSDNDISCVGSVVQVVGNGKVVVGPLST